MESSLEKQNAADLVAVETVDDPRVELVAVVEVEELSGEERLVEGKVEEMEGELRVMEVKGVEEKGVERKAIRHLRSSTPLGLYFDPNYMDPYLWRTMPMHLVELILSKVPFRNLVTMRRVCKSWSALILSEGFSPPFVPALIMFARTDTVRKMMSERNQPPVLEVKEPRKWVIVRVWNSVRSIFKRRRHVVYRRRSMFPSLHRIPNSGVLCT